MFAVSSSKYFKIAHEKEERNDASCASGQKDAPTPTHKSAYKISINKQ